MKICIDLTSLYSKLSGIEKYALNISKNMLLSDKNNDYVLLFNNEIHEQFNEFKAYQNVTFQIIKSKNKLILSQFLLPIYLYKAEANIYLFLAFQSPLAFFSKNIINTVHDMTPWLYPKTMSLKGLLLFKTAISQAMKRSRIIITISKSAKEDINRFFHNENIQVIYCGVNEEYSNFIYDEKRNNDILERYNLPKRYTLSLSTLEPRKNTALLLEAFFQLKKEGKIKGKLVLAGRKGWKYNDLINVMDGKRYENDIIFTGFIEEEDLPNIYFNAKCFIFPSLYEGFGMPPLEAMAVGVPVIVSDASSLIEVVGNNNASFKSNDLVALKTKIEEVLELEIQKRKHVIEYGKRQSQKFKWITESEKLIDLINNKCKIDYN